jgi:hypothetical protein
LVLKVGLVVLVIPYLLQLVEQSQLLVAIASILLLLLALEHLQQVALEP